MSRQITVINLTSKVLGVLGGQIGPNGTKNFNLSTLQGAGLYGIMSNTKATKLAAQMNAGLVSVVLEGDKLSADQISNLDAPVSSDLGLIREVFTNPAQADVDGIKTVFTAPVANTTYTTFNGAVGGGVMSPPRNFTIKGTTGVGEALSSKAVIVTGIDINDGVRSETITTTILAASDTATDVGIIAFKQITSVYLPLEAGTPGDYEFGFGSKIGLSAPLTQGGLVREFMDNAPLTNGTIVLAGTSAPNGTYLANTVPDGTHDYVLVYIPN